ncbi:MAG: hypothetical protein ACP5PB_05360 [Acidimicrobiales bacterium]
MTRRNTGRGFTAWSRRTWRGTAVVGVAVMALTSTAWASAASAAPKSHGGGGGGSATVTTGNDVSYPQCGSTLPSATAFGIVGVNGGLADTPNDCLGPVNNVLSSSELYWALTTANGLTNQPRASLYVNTADPGNTYNGTVITDWPTSGSTPYGACTTTMVVLSDVTYTVGQNSPACAWQYGWNMATQDTGWLTAAATAIDSTTNSTTNSATAPTSPGGYPWWLDVETANTWQSATTANGLEMNVADLQGMVSALQYAGVGTTGVDVVGAYSTSYQWGQIVGNTDSSSLYGYSNNLYQIPDWIPGARSSSGAQSNCSLPSFTGGVVTVTQWFAHPIDGDVAC